MRIRQIVLLLFPLILIFTYYWNLIPLIETHLADWNDPPFIIWIFQNNIKHLLAFDLKNIYETNAMYPFTNTLSFTEHMYFPSLIVTFISFFSKNPILQFNLFTILNHILIYISFYLLSSRFTDSKYSKVISSIFATFSPYIIGQIGHLQMTIVWPFYLAMYFNLKKDRKLSHISVSGLFLGLQFLSSVYLGLMGLYIILIREVIAFIYRRQLNSALKEMVIFLSVFIIVSLPSLNGYFQIQKEYKPIRGQEEFVNYSAHISDYFLFFPNNSLVGNYIYQETLGKLNKHFRGEMASFIGITPIVLIGYWIVKKKNTLKKAIRVNKFRITAIWLSLLLFTGLLFSIGPRANFNGEYLVFPLPYYVLLKALPFVGIMRALARWYFIFIFAVNILLIFSLDYFWKSIQAKSYKSVYVLIILSLFLIEYYPFPVQASTREWKSSAYLFLNEKCKKDNGPILEYPFEYRYKSADISKYLSLKTNTLMSSTLHSCPTLSGFSSFEPPLFKNLQYEFDTNGINDNNITLLKKYKFKYIKVNFAGLSSSEKKDIKTVIQTVQVKEIFRDSSSAIYQLKY